MSCGVEGVEGEYGPGMLGLSELDGEDIVAPTPTAPTPTPLPSIAGIRISSVSAGCGFNAAVSAAGTVYTWGASELRMPRSTPVNYGCLGHGARERSPVPKQVHGLAGHRVLSVAAGAFHCLAVTEEGEVFSWGWDSLGNAAMGAPTAISCYRGAWTR